MLQNATSLRKSAPGPPNSSDDHVSCTAPASENASLQILFKCPTPAIVFGNATKPSHFAHFWQGAQSLAPATRNNIWTPKSVPNPSVFYTFDFEICFAPQRRALFSTSQLPKVVRAWCVLYMFTSKCASRHNGVHFFDIATSKSGPTLRCLCILPSTCASRHNGVRFFISHLASWLRTRRFSEPTFRPSGASNHWKNTVFRDFPTFSRICIFFLLPLSLLLFTLLIFLFSLPTFLPFRASASSFFWLFLFYSSLF